MELGNQIKKYRQEAHLSQEELANRIYVSRQTISNWVKIEKIKKDNDIQTYKEIVAFSENRRLDEIQKQREIGKRPYQKFLLVIGCAVIAAVACQLMGLLMHIFLR